MAFTKHFKEISKHDAKLAGGKGASLGEMTQAGFPVPPGFVVLTSAFDHFLEETEIGAEIEAALHRVKHEDINSIEQVSENVKGLIMRHPMPKDIAKEIEHAFTRLKAKEVAVRSSATAEDSSTASWAGELDSYLNVTKKDVLESVKKCWSSLFTPRAIFYRFDKKLHTTRISVAVVVQQLVDSEIAGITFTVHPVTKDYDQMVIEAGYGLGEAIVGGKVTPDTYVIHKKDWKLLEKHISTQQMMIVRAKKGTIEKDVPHTKQEEQKLPDALLLKLAKLCQQIEEHYKYPQDIEWALHKGNLYILQSRPITTL